MRLNRLIPSQSLSNVDGTPTIWFIQLWQKMVKAIEDADAANSARDDTQDAALDILDTTYTRATEAWERVGPGEYSFTTSQTLPADCRTALVDCTAGAVTLTLNPLADSMDEIASIKTDATGNAMTVDGNGAETISGAANQSTTTQWVCIRVRPCPSFGQWVRT